MELSNLPKTVRKSKKRIGRGYGSGRGGHASTRGTKGQKSRGKIGLFFEGTKIKKSLIKRLPLFRGKGKFKPKRPLPLVINLKYLNVFGNGEEVTLQTLKEKGILKKDLPLETEVKILGDGEVGVSLTVFLPTSKQARQKIEKAGGRVVAPDENKRGKKEAKLPAAVKIKERDKVSAVPSKTKKKVSKKTSEGK